MYPESVESTARTDRRGFLTAAGGVALAGLWGTGRAAGRQSAASVRTIFSYPTLVGGSDTRHEESFRRLLAGAVPGSSVYFSIYLFTRERIAEAVVAAAERGVDVNVIVDERSENSRATGVLEDGLADDGLTIVSGGGVGDRINHNKFLALERLESGDTDVVWQSSSNFTNNQIHYHNSTVVVRNDPDLFEVYRSYWEDLADEGVSGRGYNRTERTETATVHFSPRTDGDTHRKALADVVPGWNTRIYFLQSIWTESREAETRLIRDRLSELVDEGCEVRAVVQQRDNRIPQLLADAGVDVVVYPKTAQSAVHSKNMLVESDFRTPDGEVERRKEVWTGTQNLSRPGLRRNDETLLRIVDDYVFNDFLDDWERVYRQARRAREELPTVRPATDTGPGDEQVPTATAGLADSTTPPTTVTATTDPPTGSGRTDAPTATPTETSSGSGPGFGPVGAVAGVVGTAAYAAYRAFADRDDE